MLEGDLLPKTESKSTLRPPEVCCWTASDGVNPEIRKTLSVHLGNIDRSVLFCVGKNIKTFYQVAIKNKKN